MGQTAQSEGQGGLVPKLRLGNAFHRDPVGLAVRSRNMADAAKCGSRPYGR